VGLITEIFGESGTGKTQFCLTLAVSVQLPKSLGGLDGRCMFIDTGKSFRPERIRSIAERFGLPPTTVLDNIIVARAHNTHQQTIIIEKVRVEMRNVRISVLIVDSATHYYRTDYAGRAELPGRQQHMGMFLRQLQDLANDFGLLVVITNHVVAEVGKKTSRKTSTSKPGGGSVVGSACQTRLSLREVGHGRRICRVYKSADMGDCESLFEISEGGIKDEEEL